MTEHRVNPLQWLSTKFASLNHSHNEYLTNHQDISGKEDISSKVTSLSENSTNTQYPSAKAVYDEYMNTKTVTPEIQSYYGNTYTLNGVTKSFYHTGIDSEDLGYYDRIIYTITFNDNTFQMCNQSVPSMGGGVVVDTIYFDGSDCYWGGEWDDANQEYAKGNLICEGNTLQAILQGGVITVNGVETNWEANGEIRIFGNGIFSYTVYSYKYISTDYLNVYSNDTFNSYEQEEQSINGETKMIWEHEFHNYRVPLNLSKIIYTITFNDNTFSYARPPFKTIYFDGTDCYEGEWDDDILVKGNLICEGNELQILYQDNYMYFPDGSSDYSNDILTYLYSFGEVVVKAQYIAPRFEYAQNKKQSLFSSYYDESIVYPSVSAVKNYAENKSNKTSSWNSTTDNTRYPTEKLVKDSLDSKEDKNNKTTSISSSSTDTQYPSAKCVYDNFIFNENLTPYTHILSNYANTSSAALSVANEVLTITGNGASNGDTGLLNTKVFAPKDEDYIISFDIRKTTGTYAGKDFNMVIGDSNHYLNISPQYYVIRFGEDGTEFNTINAISCTDYTNIKIQRINGNNWEFYVDDVLKHSFTTNSSEIPNQITFYGLHNSDVVDVKNVKITRKRIDSSNELVDMIYPVGSIYMSVNNVSPQYLFGGTWEQIKDRFLLGSGDTYANGSTGGSATVTLTAGQSGVPAHSHKYNDYNTTYTLKTTNRKPGTSTAVAYGTSLTAGGGATERTSCHA